MLSWCLSSLIKWIKYLNHLCFPQMFSEIEFCVLFFPNCIINAMCHWRRKASCRCKWAATWICLSCLCLLWLAASTLWWESSACNFLLKFNQMQFLMMARPLALVQDNYGLAIEGREYAVDRILAAFRTFSLLFHLLRSRSLQHSHYILLYVFFFNYRVQFLLRDSQT